MSLVEEYTGKESSSVTYERARQLMEAVIYCIAHMDTKDSPVAKDGARSLWQSQLSGYG